MTTYSVADLVRHLSDDGHPPLHYLIWKAWTAVAGTSIPSLRGLSVVLGTLAVALLARLVLEANEVLVGRGVKGGVTLAILLAALHTLQVEAGATARMYSLGILLAVLTAWLLLRALRAASAQSPWWLAYGLTTAAFCYVHYFAFFTILAQILFVLGYLLERGSATSWRQVFASAAGLLYAGAIALLLYTPWLPAFAAQARDVREGWWISAITADGVERVVFSWLTGMPYAGKLASRLWLGLLAGFIVWTLWRGGWPAWFFFLQAVVPWACLILLSLCGGQSLLRERYLVFAQVGMFGLWGVAWRILHGWSERLLLAGVLSSTCVYGLVNHLCNRSTDPPALADAVKWLRGHYHEGDLFVMEDYREINRFRYYTVQAGLPWLDVRSHVAPFQKGHVVHVASLESHEVYWAEDELWPAAPRRIWRVSNSRLWSHTRVPNRKPTLTRTFTGSRGAALTLVLHEPED
jgi:hypothetical protein